MKSQPEPAQIDSDSQFLLKFRNFSLTETMDREIDEYSQLQNKFEFSMSSLSDLIGSDFNQEKEKLRNILRLKKLKEQNREIKKMTFGYLIVESEKRKYEIWEQGSSHKISFFNLHPEIFELFFYNKRGEYERVYGNLFVGEEFLSLLVRVKNFTFRGFKIRVIRNKHYSLGDLTASDVYQNSLSLNTVWTSLVLEKSKTSAFCRDLIRKASKQSTRQRKGSKEVGRECRENEDVNKGQFERKTKPNMMTDYFQKSINAKINIQNKGNDIVKCLDLKAKQGLIGNNKSGQALQANLSISREPKRLADLSDISTRNYALPKFADYFNLNQEEENADFLKFQERSSGRIIEDKALGMGSKRKISFSNEDEQARGIQQVTTQISLENGIIASEYIDFVPSSETGHRIVEDNQEDRVYPKIEKEIHQRCTPDILRHIKALEIPLTFPQNDSAKMRSIIEITKLWNLNNSDTISVHKFVSVRGFVTSQKDKIIEESISNEASETSQSGKMFDRTQKNSKFKISKIKQLNPEQAMKLIKTQLPVFKHKEAPRLKTQAAPCCCICLDTVSETKGVMDCSHEFCLECINPWVKEDNSCPLCKTKSKFLRAKQGPHLVETRALEDRQLIIKQEMTEQERQIENADDHCYMCVESSNFSVMLVCDSCSEKCCHINCLEPPLEHIPEGDWYCDFCVRDKGLVSEYPVGNYFMRERLRSERVKYKKNKKATRRYKKKGKRKTSNGKNRGSNTRKRKGRDCSNTTNRGRRGGLYDKIEEYQAQRPLRLGNNMRAGGRISDIRVRIAQRKAKQKLFGRPRFKKISLFSRK